MLRKVGSIPSLDLVGDQCSIWGDKRVGGSPWVENERGTGRDGESIPSGLCMSEGDFRNNILPNEERWVSDLHVEGRYVVGAGCWQLAPVSGNWATHLSVSWQKGKVLPNGDWWNRKADNELKQVPHCNESQGWRPDTVVSIPGPEAPLYVELCEMRSSL